jgi:CRP-like cAMP-binding protein
LTEIHSQSTDDGVGDALRTAHAEEENQLLRGIPTEEYDRMLTDLRPTRLDFKRVLIEPRETIQHIYFVRDGVASVLATEQSGGDVEVGIIGNEGFVGLPILFGVDLMPYRVIVQAEGDAWRMNADIFRRIIDERAVVRNYFMRFAALYIEQVSQSVACNRLHTLEERCARWLLMTDDRVHSEEFELTHEFIAHMLGVRRAGVTVTLALLQRAEIVRYARGRMTILDRDRLEATSCECYRLSRASRGRIFGAPLA